MAALDLVILSGQGLWLSFTSILSSFTIHAWYWQSSREPCLLRHLRAERSWRASRCDLSGHHCLLLAAGGGRERSGSWGSSLRNKWCELGPDFYPSWASVSSSCKMKLGQMAPSFRPQTSVYPQFLGFSFLYPVQQQSSPSKQSKNAAILTTSAGTSLVQTALLSFMGYFIGSEEVSLLLPSPSAFESVSRAGHITSLFKSLLGQSLYSGPQGPCFHLGFTLLQSHWPPLFLRHAFASGPLHKLFLRWPLGSPQPPRQVVFRSVNSSLPNYLA